MSQYVTSGPVAEAMAAVERLNRVVTTGRAVQEMGKLLGSPAARAAREWVALQLRLMEVVVSEMEGYVAHWRQAQEVGQEEPLLWRLGWQVLVEAAGGVAGSLALVEPETEWAGQLWHVVDETWPVGGEDAS